MQKLKPEQIKILERIRTLDIFHDFYLAGGTCLCLRYNHRPSVDFDFFLFPHKRFSFTHYEVTLHDSFGTELYVVYQDPRTFIFTLENIKISLFEYPYPILKQPQDYQGIFLASDEDIACMKAIAISQGGLKKDFFDLWYLIRLHRWGPQELLSMLCKKYVDYNLAIFLKALTYFEDAEKTQDFEEVEKHWGEVKGFFVGFVKMLNFSDP